MNFILKGKGNKIIAYGKAILHFVDPRSLKNLDIIEKTLEFSFLIYDFEDFKEDFEGEKRLLKQKLIRQGEEMGFTVICIDVPEEFSFVLKSIIDYHRKGGTL